MKHTLILIMFLSFYSSFSQTNRYTQVSTSDYKPNDISYYQKLAEQKAKYIFKNSQKLHDKIHSLIINSDDNQFKADLLKAKTYLKPLLDNSHLSLKNAEWYFKKANRKYNKAIRKYNRRVKKLRKSN